MLRGQVVLSSLLAVCWMGCGAELQAPVETFSDVEPLSEGAGGSTALSAEGASLWMPMTEGNEWVFSSRSAGERAVSVQNASGAYRFVTGLHPSGGQWLGLSGGAPNSVFVWNEEAGAWGPFIRFAYRTTSWHYRPTDGACDQYVAVREASDVSVTTPAGTFTGCRTISFTMDPPADVRCAAPYLKDITFAPGVGPVAMTSGRGEVFSLKTARVGSQWFPVSLRASVQTDKAVYVNKVNTIRCIQAPCPSNAEIAVAKLSYRVTNGMQQPQTLQFPTGLQFDFELLDRAGRVVRAWSDERPVTKAPTQLVLQAGETRTFEAELPLVGRDGQPLEGSLQVRALLAVATSAGAGIASASTDIEVRVETP